MYYVFKSFGRRFIILWSLFMNSWSECFGISCVILPVDVSVFGLFPFIVVCLVEMFWMLNCVEKKFASWLSLIWYCACLRLHCFRDENKVGKSLRWLKMVEDSGTGVERRPLVPKVPGSNPVLWAGSAFWDFPHKRREYWLRWNHTFEITSFWRQNVRFFDNDSVVKEITMAFSFEVVFGKS